MERNNITSLWAIGFPGGFDGVGEDGAAGLRMRVGGRLVEVSAADYDLWWGVRAASERPLLSNWAAAEGIDDLDSRMDRLQRAGLVEMSPGSAALDRYRLITNGVGTGQDQEDVQLYSIRSHDLSVLVQIGGVAYTVWLVSDGRITVGAACDLVAQRASCQLHSVRDEVCRVLPTLLSLSVAFLDA